MEEPLKSLLDMSPKEINPFGLLGIDEWVLRSMNSSELRAFLLDFRKIIAKYHHPDKFPDLLEKKRREGYFKLASSAIDRLVSDEFYLRQSLEDFKSGETLRNYQKAMDSRDAQLVKAKNEISSLSQELARERENRVGLWNRLGNTFMEASALFNSPGAFPLTLESKCDFTYVPLLDLEYRFSLGLNQVVNSSEDLHEINENGIQFANKFVRENHSTKNERKKLAGLKRRKGISPTEKEALEKQEKTFGFAENIHMENRQFLYVTPGSPKNPKLVPFLALGSLPYSSLKAYFESKRRKIFSPEYLAARGCEKPDSAIVQEFFFQDSPNRDYIQERLRGIMPFLSPFMMPYVPLFVRAAHLGRHKPECSYELIIPVDIKRL